MSKHFKFTNKEIELIVNCLIDKKFVLKIDLIQLGDIEELKTEVKAKESNQNSLLQRVKTIENLLLKFRKFD